MKNKALSIVLSFSFLFLLTSSTISHDVSALYLPDESCENISKIYEDALLKFNTYKGEEKIRKTMLGTKYYNDYKIDLWEAQQVELTKVTALSATQLDYIYIQSPLLADAEKVYNYLVEQFDKCKPNGYISIEGTDKNYLAQKHYIDERDKEAFLFYDWPEFLITISNFSDKYVVRVRILSKKG